MTHDLDILISRYAADDVDLTPAQREAVERELGISAPANEALATEHRLTELLRSATVPEVNYGLLAARIGASLPATPDAGSSLTSQRSFWARPALALAASVLIVAGIAVPLLRQQAGRPTTGNGGTTTVAAKPNSQPPIAIVAVDGGETPQFASSKSATAPALPQVTIGPAPTLAGRPVNDRYAAETNSARPSKVVIAGDGEAIPSDPGPLAPR